MGFKHLKPAHIAKRSATGVPIGKIVAGDIFPSIFEKIHKEGHCIRMGGLSHFATGALFRCALRGKLLHSPFPLPAHCSRFSRTTSA